MMIIQFIQWLTTIFSGTNLDFHYSNAWITAIMDIVSFVSWCIPLDAIIVCFTVSYVVLAFRIVVAVWKLLPLT